MNSYDVVIIGAGIQGVGIADRLAKEGHTVLIAERNASVGLETSSNSSKLIHGGLRYLESMQFGLVYECLAQRRWLLNNMPELVSLKPFYIPAYQGGNRSPWWIFLGLTFYAILGGLKKENRFSCVPRSRWPKLGINTQGLKSVFQYYDAQTNDQQLTEAVRKSAQSQGVELICNSSLVTAKLISSGYEVTLSSGEKVKCRALVNAAGPWVNEVASLIENAAEEKLQWVQGSHIVLDIPAFIFPDAEGESTESCFYIESSIDSRAIFVLPWHGKVMVGTTELILCKPKAEITLAEKQYLLDSYNKYFPQYACTPHHIVQTFSGVRVLPLDSAQSNPNKRSRETIFVESRAGSAHYIAVYGGKLTSFRATALKVVSLLNASLA